jgi:Na+/H+-dicarboxylate symporter
MAPSTTVKTRKADDEEIAEEVITAPGCGILARYPVLSVLLFAGVGVAVGVGLSFWEPDEMEKKDKTLKWLGLVGDLFIRALKCVVLPLVFVNVIISVMEMMDVGKASSIGWKTIGLYLLTTIFAAILGILSTLSLKSLYMEGEFDKTGAAMIRLGCNAEGSFLTEGENGAITCSADYTDINDINFAINDLSSSFSRRTSGARDDISLSDTIYDGVFTKLVTSNVVGSFAQANFAAVVMFAIAFGVALSRVVSKGSGPEKSFVLNFLKEIDGVLLTIINWIIAITPCKSKRLPTPAPIWTPLSHILLSPAVAVLSLIMKAIGGQEDLPTAFENVGYLVVATIIAMMLQFFVVYVGFFAFFTRTNPFNYLKFIIPAQTMAFACASSAATIPMTLKSVKASGRVPDGIARFVIPLGATVNMDGGAIYFPCACIWLAVMNGISPDIGSYFLLVIISTIGSVGTAPVPSASLVLIITAYNTVFNTTGTPDGFSYILAIDWFMDRLRTTLNVTGDAVVAGMVASLCEMEDTDDVENVADDKVVSSDDSAEVENNMTPAVVE